MTHPPQPKCPSETKEILPESIPLLFSTPPTHPPSPKRVLYSLLIVVFFFITAIAMTVPVRPKLILLATSNDPQKASYFQGTVDSISAIITIISTPLLGAASDVVGRKPILIISHLGELIALLFIAQFPHLLFVQFLSYTLLALTNAYYTTTNTIIADISPADPIASARNFGLLGASVGIAFLVGPILGGVIEDTFYQASSFHAAALVMLLTMILVYIFLPETKAHEQTGLYGTSMSIFDIVDAIRRTEINPLPRIKTLFSHNEGLTWLGITLAVYTLAQASLNSILFLYANVRLGWGSFETGIFLSTLGLAILVSQAVLAPACVWAVGEHGTIYLGFALTAVHFAIYGFANNTALMYVGLAVGSLGFVCDPPIKAIVARQVDSHTQGSLQGSLSGLTAVVKPFGPLFSTALFSLGIRIGIIGLPLYGTAFIMALTIPCASIAFRKAGLK